MKNEKKFILIALIAFIIGAAWWVYVNVFQMLNAIEEDNALTNQFSTEFVEQLKLLKGKEYYDFPYSPAVVEWNGKYLVIESANVETANEGYLRFRYNKNLNEKLNTAQFFPNGDINGVVWVYSTAKEVGEYAGGGRAFRPYYVLHYIDLKQEAILAQDTLWGSMPPKTISAGQMGGVGDVPKEKKIIEVIKNRVKTN